MLGLASCVSVKWMEVNILQGWPFFFAHITMGWHHVMGSPIGIASMACRQTHLSDLP